MISKRTIIGFLVAITAACAVLTANPSPAAADTTCTYGYAQAIFGHDCFDTTSTTIPGYSDAFGGWTTWDFYYPNGTLRCWYDALWYEAGYWVYYNWTWEDSCRWL